jgi:hypothetical protein
MRSSLSMHYYLVWGAFSLSIVGVFCGVGGNDPSRISLKGQVTLDGKPLESGTIRFILSSYAEQPHVDVSLIEDGEYTISSSDRLIPGTYEVQIRSAAQEAEARIFKIDVDEIPPEQRMRIPARYNKHSVLEVEIRHAGLSRFDFDLKK